MPQVDINIVSGEKHYRAGGTLIKETLYGPNFKPCGALNVKKHGFFLQIKGIDPPKSHTCNFCHASVRREVYGNHSQEEKAASLLAAPLAVEISQKPSFRPEKHAEVPSEASTPQPVSAEKSGENRSESPVFDLDRADGPIRTQ